MYTAVTFIVLAGMMCPYVDRRSKRVLSISQFRLPPMREAKIVHRFCDKDYSVEEEYPNFSFLFGSDKKLMSEYVNLRRICRLTNVEQL